MNNSTIDISPDSNHRSKMRPLLLLLVSVFLSSWLPPAAHAEKNRDFDHFATGFPLSGQHLKVRCEACHIRGVFKGTPKYCAGCHNDRSASGKPSRHIITSEACDDCHTTFAWSKVAMDHSAVKADCRSCHAPYPSGHVPTPRQCDECHGTLAWESVRFNHVGITTGCRTCHAKELPNIPNDHPPICVSDCDVCHTTLKWQGAIFNHSSVCAPCSTCHLNDKPVDHIPTTEECGFCHTTQGWEGALPQ